MLSSTFDGVQFIERADNISVVKIEMVFCTVDVRLFGRLALGHVFIS